MKINEKEKRHAVLYREMKISEKIYKILIFEYDKDTDKYYIGDSEVLKEDLSDNWFKLTWIGKHNREEWYTKFEKYKLIKQCQINPSPNKLLLLNKGKQ